MSDSYTHLLPNLLKHVSNIKNVYKLPCVVAINAFPTDTKAELDLVEKKCKELGVNVVLSEVWAKGGEGGVALAEEVVRLCEQPNDQFTFSYELEGTSIEDKLNAIVTKIYGGKRVVLTANAQKQAKQLEAMGFGNCPICVAKTQYSFCLLYTSSHRKHSQADSLHSPSELWKPAYTPFRSLQ